MISSEIAPKKTYLWRRLFTLKTLLATLTIVVLLASNVANLVSASAHDWMHGALWRALSIGGQTWADRVLKNSAKGQLDQSIKFKTADLDTRNKRLIAVNEIQAKQLDEARSRSQKLAHQLEVRGQNVKDTIAIVHKRLAKGVSRNVAALPSEVVPYLGIGVTLAVTSMDIYDACQTMKDFNTLLRMMEQGEENPDLCGQKIPTVDQVVASAKTEWRASVQQVAKDAKTFEVTVPEVRLPTRDEVVRVSCAAVFVPYLCPEN